jgi:hypothetical protein
MLVALAAMGCKEDEPHAKSVGARGLRLQAVGKAQCENALVDDFEDNDTQVLRADLRDGHWYGFKDNHGTSMLPGTMQAVEGGAQGSKYAVRISGKMGTDVDTFAGLGLELSGTQLPYDVSTASGICFFAKGAGEARVQLPDVNTFPEGGRCKTCYNSFGNDFALTTEWREYCFTFDSMTQSKGWGDQVPKLTPTLVFGIQWQFFKHGTEFDLWLDDVRLTCGNGKDVQ